VRIVYWHNTKKLLERKDIMPRKKKVEEEAKNEVIKGTEVSTETAAKTKTKEMTVDEQYDLAKKALVIKAYNVLVKVEEFVDTIMAYTPNGEMAAKFAELVDNLKAENFRKELIETIVGDKDKTEKDEE